MSRPDLRLPKALPARGLSLLAALLTALVLGGCSFEFSTGDGSVPADEVAKEARASLNELAEEEGLPAIEGIECPEDLEGEVAATIECSARSGDEEFDVTATVTGVDGDQVEMEFEVEHAGDRAGKRS